MAAAKRQSKGTVLQVSIATVYTTVAQVKKIDYPDDELQYQDVTDLESDDVEDGEPNGLATPGMCSIDLWFDPLDDTHQYLLSAKAAKSTEAFKITNPDIGSATAHSCSFTGTVKKFKPTASAGGMLEASSELKLKAPATFSVAADT